MRIRDAHGFPYFWLVRLPLIALTPLAGTMIYDVFAHKHIVPSSTGFFWSSMVLPSLLNLSAGAQIIAVPIGIYAMYKASCLRSPAHWLALSCGSLTLMLAWWLYNQPVHIQ